MDPGKTFNDCSNLEPWPVLSFIIGQLTNEEIKFHGISDAKTLIFSPVYLIPRGNNM